ncbi:DUF2235 domain-containing protein [Cellulophaga sp. L1A9]|uniref:T6SS phospholipase effector Tle1-like catalytic domain-containing protein n=1 Tax=Cellulophaga sp. L1A9 TaxID=2686362 RepID=UPI00131D63FB|nr:DUF2235 domain-containing protein [Cellulophaga sp. L1A9]
MNTEESKSFISNIDVQTSFVNVGNSSYEEAIPADAVNVTVGVYFDGTQNNRKNTEAREEHDKGASGNKDIAEHYIFNEGSSFENDHSNISRSEPYYVKKNTKKHKQLSIYIEGVGTENHEEDSYVLGVAQAKGDTGIKPKVKKAFETLGAEINEVLSDVNGKTIYNLTIDTFGFSRGAAAARYFISEVTKRKGQVKRRNSRNGKEIKYKVDFGPLGEHLYDNLWIVKSLNIRFVGLYDTVASFGIDHDDDTEELNLDAIKKANHVFQIGADDEHRNKFRRTNIVSAGGRGKEVLFPGVHSDIGGGYMDGEGEKLIVDKYNLSRLEKERLYLIDQAWYKDFEIKVDYGVAKLLAERKSISNLYSFIPLHVMAEYGMSKAVDCEIGKLNDKYSIKDPVLLKIRKELDNYVWGYRDKVSFTNDADRELLKRIRHKYFHFSAHYNRSYGLTPHKPNIVDGKRIRVINEG